MFVDVPTGSTFAALKIAALFMLGMSLRGCVKKLSQISYFQVCRCMNHNVDGEGNLVSVGYSQVVMVLKQIMGGESFCCEVVSAAATQ